jgi:hypothetical protein
VRRQIFDVTDAELSITDADVLVRGLISLEVLIGRFSKARRMAVGYWSIKISQARWRSTTRPEAGAVDV